MMNPLLATLARLTALAIVAVSLFGCAHPITVSPDIAAVKTPATPEIAKRVGYYISAADKALEVTTPGGGGDKVRYFPYRDLETGLYKVLSGTFSSVTRLDEPPTAESMRAQRLVFAITPKIITDSSSDSFLTWPPTSFSVELQCRIIDDSAVEVTTVRVVGFGNATFSEFLGNFALAATRASTDALNKLSIDLNKLDALRK
jgi:hypothetical protein